MDDLYKTIAGKSPEVLFKDKGSKFYGYAFPVDTENAIKNYIEEVKTVHSSARHHCYAWQLGSKKDQVLYRANDDGEPSNTAGAPIHGQIQSFGITNVLIVVVRYFGGVKLGVGGLINAYRSTAQMALEASDIVEKTIDVRFSIIFEYKHMNDVMRIIKEKNLNIESQEMHLSCVITICVRESKADEIENSFASLYEVQLKKV